MIFHNLWALPLLLLAPLAFISLRTLRESQRVASLLYFRDLYQRRWLPNWEFRNQRERWIYAALLLVAVVLALDPVLFLPSHHLWLLLDDSASMGAKLAGGETRLAAAKRALRLRSGQALAAGDRVSFSPLWAVSPRPQAVDGPQALERMLAGAEPSPWGGLNGPRLQSLFGQAPRLGIDRIVVATDRPLAAPIAGVEWIDVAKDNEPANLAIVAANPPQGYYAQPNVPQVVIRNSGPRPVPEVRLSLAAAPGAASRPALAPFPLAAGASLTLPLDRLDFAGDNNTQWLSIDGGDALEADDGLWVAPPFRSAPLTVSLVECAGSGALWDWLLPHRALRLNHLPQSKMAQASGDIVLYDGCPDPPALDEKLHSHAVVIAPDTEGADNYQLVHSQSSWYNNPLLRDIRPLFGFVMHRPNFMKVPKADWWKPLFSHSQLAIENADGKPRAMVEPTFAAELHGHRYLYLGFDAHRPCDSSAHEGGTFRQDDCLSMVFLLMNALDWMAGGTAGDIRYLPTGALFHGDQPGALYRIEADGREQPQAACTPRDARCWPLPQAGRYRFEADSGRQELSVALLNADESDLGHQAVALQTRELAGDGTPVAPLAVWRWLLWLLSALAMWEAWLVWRRYRRGQAQGG